MSNNTRYNVIVNDEIVSTFSKKARAIEAAEALKGESLVEVKTEAGTVVHEVAPAGTRAKPFTRTETVRVEGAEDIEGFVAAYQRTRVGAVVYRALDKSGYLVVQPSTGIRLEVANTTEARLATNEMAAVRKAAKAAAAEELVEA